jgi:hypothetical protein
MLAGGAPPGRAARGAPKRAAHSDQWDRPTLADR